MRTDGINYEIYFLFFLMKRTFYIYKLCHFRIDLILHKEFYYNNKKKVSSITRYPVLILSFKIFTSKKMLRY
jgi:hypothetical protein